MARAAEMHIHYVLLAKEYYQESFVQSERGERRLDVVEFIEVSQAMGVDPCEFLRKLDEVVSGEKRGRGHPRLKRSK